MQNVYIVNYVQCQFDLCSSAVVNLLWKDLGNGNVAQMTGDVHRRQKMLHKRGYPGKLLHPKGYQKTPMSKSERHGFAQEAPKAPQVCPMGPKFWSQHFSHTTLR